MTSKPHATLLEKLQLVHDEFVTSEHDGLHVPLTIGELREILCLLRDDQCRSAATRAWYSVTYAQGPGLHGPFSSCSVTGPGLYGIHDVPALPTESQAEAMARCLSRAFSAGQRRRSEELRALLDDGAR